MPAHNLKAANKGWWVRQHKGKTGGALRVRSKSHKLYLEKIQQKNTPALPDLSHLKYK